VSATSKRATRGGGDDGVESGALDETCKGRLETAIDGDDDGGGGGEVIEKMVGW
jgi:hypothetical protein